MAGLPKSQSVTETRELWGLLHSSLFPGYHLDYHCGNHSELQVVLTNSLESSGGHQSTLWPLCAALKCAHTGTYTQPLWLFELV